MLSAACCLFSPHFPLNISFLRVSLLSVQAEGAACKRYGRKAAQAGPVRGMEAMGAQADVPVVHPAFGRGFELKGGHAILENGRNQDEQVICSRTGLIVELQRSRIPSQSLVTWLDQAGGDFCVCYGDSSSFSSLGFL